MEATPEPVAGAERSFQVEVHGLGGFELRPTRLFVWGGGERDRSERVLPLGSAPRSLEIAHRVRERQAGAVELKTLGNPVMTVALAGVHAVRALGRRLDR